MFRKTVISKPDLAEPQLNDLAEQVGNVNGLGSEMVQDVLKILEDAGKEF